MVEEVRMVSDGVMNIIVVFEEDVLRLICGCVPQSGRIWRKNILFMRS